VTLQAAEADALTVAWQPIDPAVWAAAPGGAGGAGPVYELQIRESGSPGWTAVGGALKGPAARKRNLSLAGAYSFRVRPCLEGWAFSEPNAAEFKPSAQAKVATHPLFTELFGAELVDSKGGAHKTSQKLAGCVVAVYFSASWWQWWRWCGGGGG
jgi:hypothetical protein